MSGKLALSPSWDPGQRLTRAVDAPLRLLWRCQCKPDLARRPLPGPSAWETSACAIDLCLEGACADQSEDNARGETTATDLADVRAQGYQRPDQILASPS